MLTKPIEVLLIGAGNRGAEVYGEWILNNPHRMKVTAVAEPVEERRQKVLKQHHIPAARQFKTWEDALDGKQLADVAIIATQDQFHTQPTLKALESGYDVLLEKPMAHRLEDCISLVQAAEKHDRLLQIAHVLRYTDFFQRVHQLVDRGELGQIITVSHRENVSSWHMAHSFVRGNWRRKELSSPMILAKSCHDLDILYWILNSPVKTLSSNGQLRHFIPENAPPGAPQRCLNGCPVAESCPFYAPALYLNLQPFFQGLAHAKDPVIRTTSKLIHHVPNLMKTVSRAIPSLRQLTDYQGWPRSIISENPGDEASLVEALKTGPYGKCVYHCDNDVVDHQIVLMTLENGVSVSFTMHGHSHEEGRTIRIDGSEATLLGKFSWNTTSIEIHRHRSGDVQVIEFPNNIEGGGHGGGDQGLMNAFTNTLNGRPPETLTDARSALESHLLAFAAEESRLEGTVIDMLEFKARAERMRP
jgi:predicted dehydrogenase